MVAARVGDTHVFSIYSEGFNASWVTPLDTLLAIAPLPKSIIVGDFNLHHPLWDKEERTGPGAEKLLELVIAWGLSLATPKGELTWESQDRRQSTLDLIWVGAGIITRYEGAAD